MPSQVNIVHLIVYGNYQRLKNETEAKMRKKRCPAGA